MNWQTIYGHLETRGFDVYSLGQHEGICAEPYLVLRNNGSVRRLSIEAQEYEVLLYYPISRYSEFEGYIAEVKDCMNELYPGVEMIEGEQPHYPDDDVRAYMTGIVYRVPRASKVNRVRTRKEEKYGKNQETR